MSGSLAQNEEETSDGDRNHQPKKKNNGVHRKSKSFSCVTAQKMFIMAEMTVTKNGKAYPFGLTQGFPSGHEGTMGQ
jgi:hypothetical protein